MQPKFFGTIKNGKLTLDDETLFKMYLSKLMYSTKPETKVEMTVRRVMKRRTQGPRKIDTNQNGYYWKVIIPILCKEFGYMPDEMHHALKTKFLRIGGTDEMPKVRSSSDLTTMEWEDLMEAIRIWALTDYNITIPTVEDYYNGQRYQDTI